MTNVLPIDRARMLMELGFPKPKFAVGQYWYNDFACLSQITEQIDTFFWAREITTGAESGPFQDDDPVGPVRPIYAPTIQEAEEFLFQLHTL